jgi:type IV secretion system protein VirB4
MGFDPRIETINNVEAWLGSIPVHGWYDVRKPLVSTRNLADIMPLTSIWPGLAVNPCPYYPKDTPALCYGATTGSTPWRFNLHVIDTGHALLKGPTGSGKSVALGVIAANFRAIPGGQLFFMIRAIQPTCSRKRSAVSTWISAKRKYRFNRWRGLTIRLTG